MKHFLTAKEYGDSVKSTGYIPGHFVFIRKFFVKEFMVYFKRFITAAWKTYLKFMDIVLAEPVRKLLRIR